MKTRLAMNLLRPFLKSSELQGIERTAMNLDDEIWK